MKRATPWQKILKIWKADEIHGIELIFDSCVLALRYVSVSYWLKDDWLLAYLDAREITDAKTQRIWRNNSIDAYCFIQLLTLVVLLFVESLKTLVTSVVIYILFEMYLNLFSIFFLPRQKQLGPSPPSQRPSAVNEPSTRAERSILLLLLNIVQLVLAFAIFYRASVPGLSPSGAFSAAVLAFGTLATPPGVSAALVAVQVALDFILVAAILANFVGQAGPFSKE